MSNNNEILLDNSVPSSLAHLIETRDQLMLQHGGVATRLAFDKVEQFDLHTFLKTVVPGLNKQDRTLTVMRNSVAGEYMFLLGDQVIRYHTTDVAEVPLDEMVKSLDFKKEKLFDCDLPFPLVCRSERKNTIKTTAYIPSTKRLYRWAARDEASFGVEYYPPPVWFCVETNLTGSVMGAKIAVVKERTSKWRETQLGVWPLGNAGMGGQICFGSTTTATVIEKPTEAETYVMTLERFFNSNFNNDLSHSYYGQPSELQRLYEKAPPNERLAKKIQASKTTEIKDTMRVLAVLQRPEAWRQLNYGRPYIDPEGFCV